MDETQTCDIKMAAQWYTDLLSCATWSQLYTLWMKSCLKGDHTILKKIWKLMSITFLVAPRICETSWLVSLICGWNFRLLDWFIQFFYGAFVVLTTYFHIFIMSRGRVKLEQYTSKAPLLSRAFLWCIFIMLDLNCSVFGFDLHKETETEKNKSES